MKRLLIVLFAIASLAATAEAQSNITLKVKGVRSDNGMIMVMGETGKENPPVYAMVKAQKGDVTVELSNVKGEKVNISLFHDENGDSQLERNAFGQPTEGYALKTVKLEEGKEAACEMTVYYPSSEK